MVPRGAKDPDLALIHVSVEHAEYGSAPALTWPLGDITPGLGDNSYLLISDGEAVVVDPQRDAWRFLAAANARKLRVRYVLESHVHNDYVSGALEVRAATKAEIAAPRSLSIQ